MRSATRASRESGDYYGYSLALGSAEVSLWEQVQAYRALARGGSGRRSRVAPTAACSTAATSATADRRGFIVADILSDPRGARADVRARQPPRHAVLERREDRHQQGHARQLVHRLLARATPSACGSATSKATRCTTSAASPARRRSGRRSCWRCTRVAPSPAPTSAARRRHGARAVHARGRVVTRASCSSTVPTRGSSPRSQPLAGIARIASPANGMVIAIDPDIPPSRQRVPLSARGSIDGMVLRLNGALIGSAQRNVMWSPQPGTYLLALEDHAGHTLDSARFTVR